MDTSFGLFQQYHNKIDNHRIYHKLIAISCMRYSARGVELFGGRAVAIERIKKEKILGINIGIWRVDAAWRAPHHHRITRKLQASTWLTLFNLFPTKLPLPDDVLDTLGNSKSIRFSRVVTAVLLRVEESSLGAVVRPGVSERPSDHQK